MLRHAISKDAAANYAASGLTVALARKLGVDLAFARNDPALRPLIEEICASCLDCSGVCVCECARYLQDDELGEGPRFCPNRNVLAFLKEEYDRRRAEAFDRLYNDAAERHRDQARHCLSLADPHLV